MERLTRVFEEYNQKYVCIDVCGEKCIENNEWCPNCKPFTDVMKKLAHYEDLEEQGLLHKAEIKDGTPIWYIASLDDEEPFLIKSSYIYNVTEYEIGDLEKDFWLSEEEAEAKLKEMDGEL